MAPMLELGKNLGFLPERFIFCRQVTQIMREPAYQLTWKPLKEGEIFTIPIDSTDRLPEAMARMDRILSDFAQQYPPEKHLSGRNKRKAARDLIGNLFPAVKAIMLDRTHEKELFHGLTAEQYVNTVAIPKAKEFRRDWLIGEYILDDAIKPLLLLKDDIRDTNDLVDLARRYKHKSVEIDDENQGVLYSPVEQQQIQSLLGLAYLYTLVDLCRNPEEEQLLSEFILEAGLAYRGDANIDIFLKHDPSTGKCIQYAILKPLKPGNIDDAVDRAQTFKRFENGDFDFYIQQPVRRIHSSDEYLTHGFVFFDSREKSHFSEMFKILRGRAIPVHDRHGARFVIEDSRMLSDFINDLKQKMPGWDIKEEEEKTITQSSSKPEGAKYFAYRKNHPDVQIEIQVEWFTDRQSLQGGWLTMKYNKDDNDLAFKVKQLYEGILQKLLPEEIYKVKWEDLDLKKRLIDLANAKALASLPRTYQFN